jgi:hypothetical protein
VDSNGQDPGRKVRVNDSDEAAPTTAALFAAVWDALTDLMGSSATATLVRRAAKHGASKRPGLRVLVIHKPAFEYEYVVPEVWRDDGTGRDDLGELMRNLVPLLVELTGSIATRRLESVEMLVAAGLLPEGRGGEPRREGSES